MKIVNRRLPVPVLLLSLILLFASCDQKTLERALETVLAGSSESLTPTQISAGLREALTVGISKGVDVLSRENGYFKSPYKILLPPEARKITDKLQKVPGFSQVEDVLLEKINRGAEDAAKKAKPIFVDAIRNINFADAKQILMGPGDAATRYLETNTSTKLYTEFNPVIIQSLDKFQARKYWADAVNAYNKIPFVEKANPDLDDYVTRQALQGLFSMVEKEERNIRDNIKARTTEILRRVFAAQDNR